jgi:hypothetical protein
MVAFVIGQLPAGLVTAVHEALERESSPRAGASSSERTPGSTPTSSSRNGIRKKQGKKKKKTAKKGGACPAREHAELLALHT